jgi:molybdopterin-guanine dinucleotide biosynthesis protein A
MNKKYREITGIILAGGESERMGFNKALLKIGDKTFIERCCNLMSEVYENIFLSTNDFESFNFLQLPMVTDIYNGLGPLAGIHASLIASATDNNFILSCDLPLMSEEMIRYITGYKTLKPISIAFAAGKYQHLCGIYNKSLIPAIEKILSNAMYSEINNGKSPVSVSRLVENSDAEIIKADFLSFYNEDLFFNMNTTDDFDFVNKNILE